MNLFAVCVQKDEINVTGLRLDPETNESSYFFSLCPVCLFCLCVCLYFCVGVCMCVGVCTCLFCLVVPTVLARKWSPPSRTHPGGVCLRRLRGGHHQQNISDLQRSTGTVTRWGQTSNLKSHFLRSRESFFLSVCRVALLLCCPFFRNFSNLFVFSVLITTANLFCDCTPHTSHSYAGLSIQAVQRQSHSVL